MRIETLQSTVSDNVFYLLVCGDEAALVDPIDSAQAIERVRELGVSLRWVINTHWHPDHTRGNAKVLEAFEGAQLTYPAAEASMIPGEGVGLRGGDRVALGGDVLDVLECPGHTMGHIALRHGKDLLSGDVFFVGGAGHCKFGGDVGVLYATYVACRALEDEVRFYPGHDYAVRNAEFCVHVDPDHEESQRALERFRSLSGRGASIPTTLGSERVYNPFWRCDKEALQESLRARFADVWSSQAKESAGDAECAFRVLRALRDTW